MAEGTRDYKRLESILKKKDQKREKDLSRVKGRLDTVLAEIKALINGITTQYNEIKN